MVFRPGRWFFPWCFPIWGPDVKVAKIHSNSKRKKEPKASFSMGFRSYVRQTHRKWCFWLLFLLLLLWILASFSSCYCRGFCCCCGWYKDPWKELTPSLYKDPLKDFTRARFLEQNSLNLCTRIFWRTLPSRHPREPHTTRQLAPKTDMVPVKVYLPMKQRATHR